nr:PREDICTED: receptor-like protein 12 [Daucus carota subsp. sativus]
MIPHEIMYTNGMGTDDIVVNRIEATVTSFSRMFPFSIKINDLMVNWKKATQGAIPDSLGNPKRLKLLNVSNNRLSGHIPQNLGDLKSLETLDLFNNNISGTIPQSFTELKQLSLLDVSNNKLSGKIPRGGQMDKINDPRYFANNRGLCGIETRVQCSQDEPTLYAHEEGNDGEQESWFLWAGLGIGFPLGFILSVVIAFVGGYLVPTQKHHSVHHRQIGTRSFKSYTTLYKSPKTL